MGDCVEVLQAENVNQSIRSFVSFAGQREKDAHPDTEATIHGLFTAEIVHRSYVDGTSSNRGLWSLYAHLFPGEFDADECIDSSNLLIHSLWQSLYGFSDGYDMQDLVLLQTFLGLSLAVGIVASGSSINKTCQVANNRKIRISRQYVCQGCAVLVSISIVILSMLSTGYHTLCIVTWFYGLGLGGYRCKFLS